MPELNEVVVRFKMTARVAALIVFCLMAVEAFAASWTKVTQPAPGNGSPGTMLLLTDGTVTIQDSASANWLRLTPDAKGSYIDGTWTSNPISPMSTNRRYYASQVMPSGKVWILGGEFYGPNLDPVVTATGEEWDPVTNTWSPIASFPPQNCTSSTYHVTGNLTAGSAVITNLPSVVTPMFLPGFSIAGEGIPPNTTISKVTSATEVHISKNATETEAGEALTFTGTPESCYGDVPSTLLQGGKILTASLVSNATYFYDIATNSFSFAANKVYNDSGEEEGWTRLSNGKILTYDFYQSVTKGNGYAELYDPATNKWSSISPADGSAGGTLPVLSSAALYDELGPALRLLDGRIFLTGANGHTALYDPATNNWAAGPDIQGSLNGVSVLFSSARQV